MITNLRLKWLQAVKAHSVWEFFVLRKNTVDWQTRHITRRRLRSQCLVDEVLSFHWILRRPKLLLSRRPSTTADLLDHRDHRSDH